MARKDRGKRRKTKAKLKHNATPERPHQNAAIRASGGTIRVSNSYFGGNSAPLAITNGRAEITNTYVDTVGMIRQAEEIHTAGPHVEARVKSDVDRGHIVTATRTTRFPDRAEEERALSLLGASYGAGFQGIHVAGYEYFDGFLRNETEEIGVQVRFLDDELIAELGRSAASSRDLTALPLKIQQAISQKSLIDPDIKSQTILALYSPVPFGTIVSQRIVEATYDSHGFAEIWVCPESEAAFPIVRHTPAPRRPIKTP